MSIDEIIRPAVTAVQAAEQKRGPFGLPLPKLKMDIGIGASAAPRVVRGAASVGGVPMVSLLPPELEIEAKRRAIKYRLVAGVVVVAIAAGGGIAWAAGQAQHAALDAQGAQAQVTDLNLQIAKYAPISRTEASIALGKSAERVGSSTQIDWQKVIGQVESSMPADYTVSGVSIASGSPIQEFSASAVPLQNGVVGSLTIIVKTSSIDTLPAWLVALHGVKGYSDASPAISSDGTTFTVTVVLHVTDAAYITPLTKGAVK